mgnify:CR=1 FL=1
MNDNRIPAILNHTARLNGSVDAMAGGGGGDNVPLDVNLLACPGSMWASARDQRDLFGDVKRPPLMQGKFDAVNLYVTQRCAIARAVAYFLTGSDEFVVTAKSTKNESAPIDMKTTLGKRCRLEAFDDVVGQIMGLAPGAGKTAILVWVCVLCSSNALVLVQNGEQALQFTEMIYKHTNIGRYFDVILLDPTNRAQGKAAIPLYAIKNVSDGRPFLPRGCGIVITDQYMYKSAEMATDERLKLKTRLMGGGRWDLVALDECDAVFAPELRETFLYGTIGPALPEDSQRPTEKRHYRLMFGKMLAVSGTPNRPDAAGDADLHSLGPVTYHVKSKDLEKLGYLARSTHRIVRCGIRDGKAIDDWLATALNDFDFSTVSADKLRVLEHIVRLHLTFGHKLMIFTEYMADLGVVERMFPGCFAVSGDTGGTKNGRDQLFDEFKMPVAPGHRQLWATTSINKIGADVPDLDVVIVVRGKESSAHMRQVAGRASRNGTRRSFFYDLVDVNECVWASAQTSGEAFKKTNGVPTTVRYDWFVNDGYENDMIVVDGDKLIEQMRAYLSDLNGGGGVKLDGERVKSKCFEETFVLKSLFDDRKGNAALDLAVTCAWLRANVYKSTAAAHIEVFPNKAPSTDKPNEAKARSAKSSRKPKPMTANSAKRSTSASASTSEERKPVAFYGSIAKAPRKGVMKEFVGVIKELFGDSGRSLVDGVWEAVRELRHATQVEREAFDHQFREGENGVTPLLKEVELLRMTSESSITLGGELRIFE